MFLFGAKNIDGLVSRQQRLKPLIFGLTLCATETDWVMVRPIAGHQSVPGMPCWTQMICTCWALSFLSWIFFSPSSDCFPLVFAFEKQVMWALFTTIFNLPQWCSEYNSHKPFCNNPHICKAWSRICWGPKGLRTWVCKQAGTGISNLIPEVNTKIMNKFGVSSVCIALFKTSNCSLPWWTSSTEIRTSFWPFTAPPTTCNDMIRAHRTTDGSCCLSKC